jgi:hypothetical protein
MNGPFEVLRFSGDAAGAEVAVLELEGRFASGARRARRPPRLRVEEGYASHEAPPVSESEARDGIWRASYAIPIDLLEQGSFALALDDVLLDLPRPDLGSPGAEDVGRHVRLAREANELRRRLDSLRAEQAAASVRAAEAEAALSRARDAHAQEKTARQAAEGQRDETRAALDAERQRAAAAAEEAREQLEAARRLAVEDVEAACREADARLASAEAETEAARREAAEQVAAAQAETEKVRVEGEQRLAEVRAEADREAEAERAAAAQRLEDAMAAERARSGLVRHELLAARAELEALQRARPPVRRARPGDRIIGEPVEDDEPTGAVETGDDEEPTRNLAPAPTDEPTAQQPPAGAAALRAGWRASADPSAAPDTAEIEPEPEPAPTPLRSAAERAGALWSHRAEKSSEPPAGEDAEEGVRLLSGAAPRPRHRPEDEPTDVRLPPGAAEIGARHFEPAGTGDRNARTLAIVALSLALLLFVAAVLGVPPF